MLLALIFSPSFSSPHNFVGRFPVAFELIKVDGGSCLQLKPISQLHRSQVSGLLCVHDALLTRELLHGLPARHDPTTVEWRSLVDARLERHRPVHFDVVRHVLVRSAVRCLRFDGNAVHAIFHGPVLAELLALLEGLRQTMMERLGQS